MIRIQSLWLAGTFLLGACSGARPGADSTGAPVGNDTLRMHLRITQLEADARALAHREGCESAGGCRSAPVGVKGCGGPRRYIVYCAATTDSAALFRKLDELAAEETRYNKATNAISTCELRLPPVPGVTARSCNAPPP